MQIYANKVFNGLFSKVADFLMDSDGDCDFSNGAIIIAI